MTNLEALAGAAIVELGFDPKDVVIDARLEHTWPGVLVRARKDRAAQRFVTVKAAKRNGLTDVMAFVAAARGGGR